MIDQKHINLLELIGRDTLLKRVASTDGGEYHGACPFCGGKDRFRVQPLNSHGGRWACRGCEAHGDAIAYVQKRDNVDFKTAVRILGLGDVTLNYPRFLPKQEKTAPQVNDQRKDYLAFQDQKWQKAADSFHLRSLDTLHSPQGRVAFDYLLGRRLSEAVIEAYCLGFNPHSHHEQWGTKKVWLPSGIVIPWELGGQYWNIRIRRLGNATPKYLSPAGIANGLYFGYGYQESPITPRSLVVLTEGEFDAMMIRVEAASIFGARVIGVATGSASGGRTLQSVCELAIADQVLLAFDNDVAGDAATLWWKNALGERAFRLRPTQHDITDMVLSGENIVTWINTGLGKTVASYLPYT